MVIALIIITVAVSALSFKDGRLFERLSLKPYMVVKYHQWDRMISHGFVHADWTHLLVNMFVMWSFSTFVLHEFTVQYSHGAFFNPIARFLLLYLGGLVAASVYDVVKRKNNPAYTSVGASGAVSAVVFCSVFLSPMSNVYIMAAIPMPAILFAVMYMAYEAWSARQGKGRINHHAHIFGAIYGFVFPVLTGGFSQVEIFINGFQR